MTKSEFSRHEALQMSLFLAESVERQLLDNEWVKAEPELHKMADEACTILNDLYQAIGNKI